MFKVKIGKRFFLSKSSLFGDIYFEFQGTSFPEKNWNDFILIILHWWLEALKKLPKDAETEFHFMDGSFEISVKLEASKKECSLKFIERMVNCKKVLGSINIPLKLLISELLSAFESLEEAIKAPESVLLLSGPNSVETIVPSELMNRIKSNPSIFREYNDLKKSYHSILEIKTKLLEP